MRGWVYRRPPTIRRRRHAPSTGRAASLAIVRRAAWHVRRRRRAQVRLRRVVPLGAAQAAVSMPPVARRALRRAKPPALRARRVVLPPSVAAPAATSTPPVLRRAVLRAKTPILRARRVVLPPSVAPAAPGQGMVMVRMLRAVSRMRRAARARLLWLPRRPTDTIERVEAPMIGNIAGPGMVRGRIVGGGD